MFPLQLGDGSYTVELFENVSGKKHSAEGKVSVNVKLDDPYAPFLGPNQYVNYTPDTEAVQTSYELCAGMTDPQEIFETVQAYIKANYLYDYVKAETVKSGTLPDIDGCYESKMGICQDLAAMAACMLRVQGIPTRLMIGYAGKMYHAWNTVIINGEEVLYDPTLELSAIDSGLTYTVERYYLIAEDSKNAGSRIKDLKGKDGHMASKDRGLTPIELSSFCSEIALMLGAGMPLYAGMEAWKRRMSKTRMPIFTTR